MSSSEIPIDAIKQFELFHGLSDDCLTEFASRFKRRSFLPLQRICHQGSSPENVYFMTAGLALAYRRKSGTEDRVPIVFFYPGAIIGEVEPILGCTYQTHVKCFAPTEALELSVQDYVDLLESHLSHSNLTALVCNKLVRSVEAFETRMLESTTEAMLVLVSEYARANNLLADENGFISIDPNLRPKHLGMYSGVSKRYRRIIFKSLAEIGAICYTNEEGSAYKINLEFCRQGPKKTKRKHDTEDSR